MCKALHIILFVLMRRSQHYVKLSTRSTSSQITTTPLIIIIIIIAVIILTLDNYDRVKSFTYHLVCLDETITALCLAFNKKHVFPNNNLTQPYHNNNNNSNVNSYYLNFGRARPCRKLHISSCLS